MKYLSDDESRQWAEAQHYDFHQGLRKIQIPQDEFHRRRFVINSDAGWRVAFSRMAWEFLGADAPEVLIWVTTCGVWPSGENIPLIQAARAGLGTELSIEEAPGVLCQLGEGEVALSHLTMAFLFLWDCWLLTPAGDGIFASHDEFGYVFSRNPLTKMQTALAHFTGSADEHRSDGGITRR